MKEKVLTAHRVGIRRLLLSEGSLRDGEKIPAEVRDALVVTVPYDFHTNVAEALTVIVLPD